MSSGPSPPVVRMTRTGRRVFPTPAAAAAAADKAASDKEKEKNISTPTSKELSSNVVVESSKTTSIPATSTATRMSSRTGTIGRTAAAKIVKSTDESVKEKESPRPSPVGKDKEPPKKSEKDESSSPGGDTPKRRGLRNEAKRTTVRVSSGSNDESATMGETISTPAKRAKTLESDVAVGVMVEEEQVEKIQPVMHVLKPVEKLEVIQDMEDDQMETTDKTDDFQIFEAVAKMNAEAAAASAATAAVTVIDDHQQRSAVNSILSDTTISIVPAPGPIVRTEIDVVRGFESAAEQVTQVVDVNPPWNEQGCIICNVDIAIDDATNQAPKSEQLKEFFLEFFSIGDQISLEDENAFPFCSKCAEEMDGLLSVSQNIESMHKQFNKVRDSMARKAIKTFLSRTKPNCLEEDAKAENYGFLDEEQKKSYKDQMFQLWKSRYELVQPGPKTPIMIRSMDSRGRVTVVRLNSHGQAVPDKFGGVRGVVRQDVPLGGMGRLLTNGDDDEDSGGNGMGGETLEIYQCKECPKAFSAKSLLAYHSRVHSGELPYECDQCGKAFSVPHYLVTHMKTHSGEKPYKCLECGKGFAQRGGLVTHSLVHTGAKPFSCQICGKSFRQKYHLTQHNLIHSGVKPFSCELCGKAFNVKMNLREHMRRHTGDRPYKCPYCTTVGFFRKKMLKEHIIKAHPQRAMPEELMASEPSTSYATHDEEDEEDLEESAEEILPEEVDDDEEEIVA